MDLFGYMFFASIFIAPMPSAVIKFIGNKTNSILKGKIAGLGFLFTFTTLTMVCIRNGLNGLV